MAQDPEDFPDRDPVLRGLDGAKRGCNKRSLEEKARFLELAFPIVFHGPPL
jgi:hypothetical protein